MSKTTSESGNSKSIDTSSDEEVKIIDQTTKFSSSIKEGSQTVTSVTFEVEEGHTYRYLDRNFDKERSFNDTLIFEKLEVVQND